MADYKGIYYNDDKNQKCFEGGAHFKYKQLCKILEKLVSVQKIRMKREKLIQDKEIKKKEKIKKSKKPEDKISKNKENNCYSVSIFIIIYCIFRNQRIKIVKLILK